MHVRKAACEERERRHFISCADSLGKDKNKRKLSLRSSLHLDGTSRRIHLVLLLSLSLSRICISRLLFRDRVKNIPLFWKKLFQGKSIPERAKRESERRAIFGRCQAQVKSNHASECLRGTFFWEKSSSSRGSKEKKEVRRTKMTCREKVLFLFPLRAFFLPLPFVYSPISEAERGIFRKLKNSPTLNGRKKVFHHSNYENVRGMDSARGFSPSKVKASGK